MTVLKIYPTATVVVCGDSKSLMHQRLLVRAGSVNNRTGSTQWLRATLKLGEPVNFCELRHNPFEAQAAPPLVLSRYKWSISHTLGNPEILRKQRPILVQSLLTKHFPPSRLTGFFCLKKSRVCQSGAILALRRNHVDCASVHFKVELNVFWFFLCGDDWCSGFVNTTVHKITRWLSFFLVDLSSIEKSPRRSILCYSS